MPSYNATRASAARTMKSPIARGDIKASFRSERPNPGRSIAPKCVVSASRDQVGKYALGPRTVQQSVRVSRIAFHETNGHAVDDPKGRLAFDLTQTLVLLARCHDTFSSGPLRSSTTAERRK